MKPRAFVVMPFNQRSIEIVNTSALSGPLAAGTEPQTLLVDFDSVWNDLIKPALELAGCEAFRADSEISAGDIRTDMFFELVTADYVVADLSITNANVYYELGIRDGVCSRGAFIIDGGWPLARPFDVAQDRSFRYNGKLFEVESQNHHDHPDGHGARGAHSKPAGHAAGSHEATGGHTSEEAGLSSDAALKAAKLNEARKLADVFQRAFRSDFADTGSPLYSHLSGLKSANWENIDTSRARAFGSLQSDWQERVRRAQELNRPGHILTIAEYAPTRMHRTRILSEAAIALIGLERFAVAEDVLEQVLQVSPEDSKAQLYLAIARLNNGDLQGAEHQLRTMLRQHDTDPWTNMALGYVYRLLWHLTWRNAPNPRERAKESPRMLLESIGSFCKVHTLHADQYRSGYNALLLIAVAQDLFADEIKVPLSVFDPQSMTTVVRYVATSARQQAQENGDYEEQFWSSVALSGLELLADRKSECLQHMRDACETPASTLFDLRLMEERAKFLLALEFKTDILTRVLDIVQQSLKDKAPTDECKRVIVFHGHPLDKSDAERVLPPAIQQPVHSQITGAITEWNIGPGDLAICSACTECDVFFGEQCLERGARVRVLLLEPTKIDLVQELSDPDFGEWANRRSAFLARVTRNDDLWFHHTELGRAVDATSLAERHSRWIMNTARIDAERATSTTGPCLYGLALSDGSLNVDKPEDSSYFVAEIRKSVRYQGVAKVIDLRAIKETSLRS